MGSQKILCCGNDVLFVDVARDLMVQESIIADLQRKGLTIASVGEPDLCSADPSRILMRQTLGAFFQLKTLLVAKLKAVAHPNPRYGCPP
jgi:hypothetical protein